MPNGARRSSPAWTTAVTNRARIPGRQIGAKGNLTVEVADRARKHCISDADIQAAVVGILMQAPLAPDCDLLIGPDTHGRLLEIVILDPDTDPVIIHAMPLPAKFHPLVPRRR